jgi:hypothetical protein
MEHIFYFFGVFAFLFELIKLGDPERVHKFGNAKYEKGTKEKEAQVFFGLLLILYLAWAFIGLFTCQWPFFLSILCLPVFNSIFKNNTWRRIDSILTIILLLGIVLNKYQIHYQFNLFQ